MAYVLDDPLIELAEKNFRQGLISEEALNVAYDIVRRRHESEKALKRSKHVFIFACMGLGVSIAGFIWVLYRLIGAC